MRRLKKFMFLCIILVLFSQALAAPHVDAGMSKIVYVGDLVTFEGKANDSDSECYIAKYEWDFNGDGEYDWISTTTSKTTHVYKKAGTYTANLRATNNEGWAVSDNLTVEVKQYGGKTEYELGITAENIGRNTYDYHLFALEGTRDYFTDINTNNTIIQTRIKNLVGRTRNFLIKDVIPKNIARVYELNVTPSPDILNEATSEIEWNVTLGYNTVFEVTYFFEKEIDFEEFASWNGPTIYEFYTYEQGNITGNISSETENITENITITPTGWTTTVTGLAASIFNKQNSAALTLLAILLFFFVWKKEESKKFAGDIKKEIFKTADEVKKHFMKTQKKIRGKTLGKLKF